MEAMETGEHEEGRSENARGKLKVQVFVGMHVLKGLKSKEYHA